jgi:hypothetical protein
VYFYVRTENVMSQLSDWKSVFWEETRQPVERGSECRATHTYRYTLATALTPLPRWRGLPREHVYVRTMLTTPTSVPVAPECLYFKSLYLYVHTCYGTMVHYTYHRTYMCSTTMVAMAIPW